MTDEELRRRGAAPLRESAEELRQRRDALDLREYELDEYGALLAKRDGTPIAAIEPMDFDDFRRLLLTDRRAAVEHMAAFFFDTLPITGIRELFIKLNSGQHSKPELIYQFPDSEILEMFEKTCEHLGNVKTVRRFSDLARQLKERSK